MIQQYNHPAHVLFCLVFVFVFVLLSRGKIVLFLAVLFLPSAAVGAWSVVSWRKRAMLSSRGGGGGGGGITVMGVAAMNIPLVRAVDR